MSVEIIKEPSLLVNNNEHDLGAFLLLLENNIHSILVAHILISLLLSFFLARFISTRFVVDADKDSMRITELQDKSLLFRTFYIFSLSKNNMIMSLLFMFIFSLSIPILGYFFAIWIALYLRNVVYEKRVANTDVLRFDEFRTSFLIVDRIFEEGSISDLMKNRYAPLSKKLKALSMLSKNLSSSNIKIIHETLSSTDDEIRMFGYSIINKAEKALNEKINFHLGVIDSIDKNNNLTLEDESLKAKAANELAFLYWEMIYTELSHESMKDGFLEQVEKYIKIAKIFYMKESKKEHHYIESLETELKEIDEQIQHTSIEKRTRKKLRNLKLKRLNILDKIEEVRVNVVKYDEVVVKLYVLMGRVYMQQDKLESAETEFAIANELHIEESSFILPYLAEMHFLKGNYKIVSAIMQKSTSLELNSTLNPVIEQWRGK